MIINKIIIQNLWCFWKKNS